jgi:hypothetical protein
LFALYPFGFSLVFNFLVPLSLCTIWSLHGGWIQLSLLKLSAMWEWRCNTTFRTVSVPPSSGLMMMNAETASEMSDYNVIRTRPNTRYDPVTSLTSYILLLVFISFVTFFFRQTSLSPSLCSLHYAISHSWDTVFVVGFISHSKNRMINYWSVWVNVWMNGSPSDRLTVCLNSSLEDSESQQQPHRTSDYSNRMGVFNKQLSATVSIHYPDCVTKYLLPDWQYSISNCWFHGSVYQIRKKWKRKTKQHNFNRNERAAITDLIIGFKCMQGKQLKQINLKTPTSKMRNV